MFTTAKKLFNQKVDNHDYKEVSKAQMRKNKEFGDCLAVYLKKKSFKKGKRGGGQDVDRVSKRN